MSACIVCGGGPGADEPAIWAKWTGDALCRLGPHHVQVRLECKFETGDWMDGDQLDPGGLCWHCQRKALLLMAEIIKTTVETKAGQRTATQTS